MPRILGVVLVLVLILAGCGDDDESAVLQPPATEQQTATATEPAAPEPQAAPATEATAEGADASEVWDPILATTRAREAPPVASCPNGTDPDGAGPSGQKRPVPAWVGNRAAAFDTHAGRVVYVDRYGATWTFDVCANSWQLMSPTGTPMMALREGSEGVFTLGLVYDVDSDVTVALGYHGIAVYDATTNTWTDSVAFDGPPGNPWGLVYDPVSGLILANAPLQGSRGEPDGLWAFDVDTDRWTPVGLLPAEAAGLPLIGYVAELDRLVFGIYSTAIEPRGAVVDPRTGQGTPIDGLPAEMAGGFGSYIAGTDAHTTYFQSAGGAICGFDPATTQWSACHTITGETRTDYNFAAIVGDPINDRLVLINGLFGNWWVNAVDTVWAMEPDSGTWTRILAPQPDDDPAVFSFAEHDLCEWVTEDEVAEFVAAEFDWEGTATEAEAVVNGDPSIASCQWELASASRANERMMAGDAGLWRDFDGNQFDIGVEIAERGVLDHQGPIGSGRWVVGHPAVSDGVVVYNGGWGNFAFGVPPNTEWLWLSTPFYRETDWDEGVASEEYEARYFGVANRFLEALGWLPDR